MKPKLKGMVHRLFARHALLVLCLAVFVVSAYMLISYYAQGSREESAFQKLAAIIAERRLTPLYRVDQISAVFFDSNSFVMRVSGILDF